MSRIIALVGLFSVACSGGELLEEAPGGNACQRAEAHAISCGVQGADFGGACDAEATRAAEGVLARGCDEMDVQDDKSDFWASGNPLCAFMTPAQDTVAEGGLCCFDYNCEGEGVLVCNDFKCAPPAAVGGACERDKQCAEGLICAAAEICAVPLAAGDACASARDCARDLVCVNNACAPLSAEGDACDENEDCAEGLRCLEGACAPQATDDVACQSNNDCAVGLTCAEGLCVTVGEASACDVGDDGDCGSFEYCIRGACAPQPQLGEACEREPRWMCASQGICWEGICEAAHAEGGGCLEMADCAFGLFCKDGVCGP